jgi:hypothetical protein
MSQDLKELREVASEAVAALMEEEHGPTERDVEWLIEDTLEHCKRYEGTDPYEVAADIWSEVRDERACEMRELEMSGEQLIDGVGFADPGGQSALRAATPENPRNLPCPNCGEPDRLTPADRARGYQCDSCARAAEGWGP